MATPGPALEVDPNAEDNDSTLGSDDVASETTSVASSIMAYRMENGRRYHAYKEGSYLYPNDERENDRLDLQHHLFHLTFGKKLFLAPIGTDPQRVLDVGTGTGIWAIDFGRRNSKTLLHFRADLDSIADMYESAEVIGTDLSPIQPSFVPPNVSFMVDDAEAEWTFNKKFDFINMRGMVGSFMDISKVIQRCYDNLKPGGWLEIPDVAWPMYADDETIEGSAVYKWSKLMVEAGAKLGRPLTNVQKYGQMLRDSGFTNISEKVFRWPINDWPQDKHYKTLGLWARQNLLDGLQALSMKLFTLALGWKSEEVEVFLVDVRKEVMSRKIHGYYAVYDVYGQKPISNLPESD